MWGKRAVTSGWIYPLWNSFQKINRRFRKKQMRRTRKTFAFLFSYSLSVSFGLFTVLFIRLILAAKDIHRYLLLQNFVCTLVDRRHP